MKKCFECGKELKFWEGYFHPILGHKELICWKCFEKIEHSLEEYRRFVLDSFKKEEQKLSIDTIKNQIDFYK